MHLTRPLSATALAAACLVALTGCGTAADTGSTAEAPAAEAAAFPRTIDIPAGAKGGEATQMTIEAEPQAIAALDYESAEAIAELGLADHLVLIPEAVLNPALGGHVDELSKVPGTFPVAMNLDPETVIAAAPDLVISSPRHGMDDTIGETLEQAGIQSMQLPSSWTSVATLTQNIDLIGQATGADAAADKLTAEIEQGLVASGSADDQSEATDAPTVLVLNNQAGRPFITAGEAFPLELLTLAGGHSAGADLGMRATGPITAEQIIEADPAGIVLIDMNGSGDRLFKDLLDNPGIAALPAVANDKILRVTGQEVQALGLNSTVDGLAKLSTWVATLG